MRTRLPEVLFFLFGKKCIEYCGGVNNCIRRIRFNRGKSIVEIVVEEETEIGAGDSVLATCSIVFA